MSSESGALKLLAVKTSDKVFITLNKDKVDLYDARYMFDGIVFDNTAARNTYLPDWKYIDKMPSKVERKTGGRKEFSHMALKAGIPESPTTPAVINRDITYNEDDEWYHLSPLYDRIYIDTPVEFVPIDVEWAVMEYDGQLSVNIDNASKINHRIIDELTNPSILLQTKPCTLSAQDTYDIIRDYIKRNIDPRFARVASDYDFCFTVSKDVEYVKERIVKVDTANSFFTKKRKPKYETRYIKSTSVIVFEMAPKPYKGYPVVVPFSGDSVEDLNKNIKAFLDDLMFKINMRVIECPKCHGYGCLGVNEADEHVLLHEIKNA